MKNKRRRSIGEPSTRELGSSVDTGVDGVRNEGYEELLRDLEENARLGFNLRIRSARNARFFCHPRMAFLTSQWVSCLETRPAPIMPRWSGFPQLSSPHISKSSFELKRSGGDCVEDKMKTEVAALKSDIFSD